MGSIVLYSLFHCDSGKCGNLVKKLATSYFKGIRSFHRCSVAANIFQCKKVVPYMVVCCPSFKKFAAPLPCRRGSEVYFE
jgi:hypothetical protein